MAGPSRAAGHPDYSSDGSYGFIPDIWAASLEENFYKRLTFANCTNTKYEGQIKGFGDEINIRTTPTFTISDYQVGGGLTYEKPVKALVLMKINRAKSFSFELNDVDAKQSDLALMDEWAMAATKDLQVEVDADVIGNVYTGAQTGNKGSSAGVESGDINLGVSGTPKVITSANVIDFIVDVGVVMDEANVPEEDRKLVLPPWMCGMIQKSELGDASFAGDSKSIVRENGGRIGLVRGFEVFASNNIAKTVDGTDTVFNVFADHPSRVSFAAQIDEMEVVKNPNDFGELCRSLMVYGYKVTTGDGVVHGYITKG